MELNFLITVLERKRKNEMTALLQHHNVQLILTLLGKGTASREQLSLYGLEPTEKAVICAVSAGNRTRQIMKSAKRKLNIDIPGNGIMMAIPVKSVGGGKTLAYLTDNTPPDGTVPAMNFEHELIVVILNEGYTDPVMNAARSAGATGGTILHAKGTARETEKFFGVSLAQEKEVILIVSRTGEKGGIMQAVNRRCGPSTPAGAISFSLPISAVSGLRILED
ncbi:MAG: P-II family nitrogen regulator [Oscillospiraceae bacterium]|nr:P-II family nitrogen regulator [Oscillospiraceae bacterium]